MFTGIIPQMANEGLEYLSRIALPGERNAALELVFRGPLRLSLTSKSELEILLGIGSLNDPGDDPCLHWLPFSEYGYYPLGARFLGDRTIFPIEPTVHVSRLTLQEDFLVPDGQMLSLERPISPELESQLNSYRHRRTLDRSQHPPITLANGEIGRFYLSAISLMAADLLSLDIKRKAALNRICDPKQTKWLDPGLLQVAPRFGLMSKPAAMQLALVTACEDILDYWTDVTTQFRALHAENRPLVIHRWLPQRTDRIEATTRSRTIRNEEGGPIEGVLELREIVRDFREVGIQSLIVQLPFGVDRGVINELNAGLADPQIITEPRSRSLLDRLLRLSGARPGSRSVAVAMAGKSLSRAFPAMAGLPVEFVRKTSLFPVAIPRKETSVRIIDAAGMGHPTPYGAAARILHGYLSEKRRNEIDFNRLLAPPSATTTPAWEHVQIATLSAHLHAFCQAGVILSERGLIARHVQSSLRGRDGYCSFVRVPQSAGRRPEGASRNARRIFAIPVILEEYFFWVVEIEPSARGKSHGIGVVMPIGEFEPSEFLQNYIANILYRYQRVEPGSAAAPFPSGTFIDAHVAYLKHMRRRLIPIRLAQAIEDRCKRMLDEARILWGGP